MIFAYALFIFLFLYYLNVRMKKSNYSVFLNPLFYLTVMMFLYGVIPSFINLTTGYHLFILQISQNSENIATFWCTYFFIIFFGGFYISKDPEDKNICFYKDKTITNVTRNIIILLVIFIFILYLYILLINYSSLAGLPSRMDKFIYYKANILDGVPKFSLSVKLYCLFLFILSLKFKSLKVWILIFPLLSLDFIVHGRRFFLEFIFYFFISVYFLKREWIRYVITFGFVFMLLASILRTDFTSSQSILPKVINMFGEFINTREGLAYIIQNNLHFDEGLLSVFSRFLLTIFPYEIWHSLTGYDSFSVEFTKYYDINFGLAGHIVSESMFYGGEVFSIVSPIIISLYFLIINKLGLYKNFLGLILLSMYCSKIIWLARGEFYGDVNTVLFTYFIYVIPFFLFELFKRKY